MFGYSQGFSIFGNIKATYMKLTDQQTIELGKRKEELQCLYRNLTVEMGQKFEKISAVDMANLNSKRAQIMAEIESIEKLLENYP